MSVAIVDASSLYLVSRNLGVSVHYGKLRDWLEKSYKADHFFLCASLGTGDSYRQAWDTIEAAEQMGWDPEVVELDKHDKRATPVGQMAFLMGIAYEKKMDVVLIGGNGELEPAARHLQTDLTILFDPNSISNRLLPHAKDVHDIRLNLKMWAKK